MSAATESIRILAVDDHPIVRQGVPVSLSVPAGYDPGG